MNRKVHGISDLWLSATALPDPLPELVFDDARTVFIVARRYRADKRLVRQALARAGFSDPVIIPLSISGRGKKSFDRALAELGRDEGAVRLVPVSVFWGRRPAKESSIWRTMFSDNWVVPGIIGRFITIVTQGRRVECFFSPALSLDRLKKHAATEDDLIRNVSQLPHRPR